MSFYTIAAAERRALNRLIRVCFILIFTLGSVGAVEMLSAGQNNGQASYGDCTFNSSLRLEVYAKTLGDVNAMRIGETPSKKPLDIPACSWWAISPRDPAEKTAWSRILEEIRQKEIPGFATPIGTTDKHLARLKRVTELRVLYALNKRQRVKYFHPAYVSRLERPFNGTLISRLPQVSNAGLRHLHTLNNLRVLNLSRTQVSDGGLHHLRKMKQLRELYLVNVKISGKGLVHLKALNNLRVLNLRSTEMNDAKLAAVKNFKSLQVLSLADTPVRNRGIAHLKSIKTLRRLYLGRTAISNKGLRHLRRLKNLRVLNLSSTEIDDGGMKFLQDLTELRVLDLSDTDITDSGLAALRKMKQLRELYLLQTRISDEGMRYLKGLNNLRKVRLHYTRVLKEGLEELRQSIPGTVITP